MDSFSTTAAESARELACWSIACVEQGAMILVLKTAGLIDTLTWPSRIDHYGALQ